MTSYHVHSKWSDGTDSIPELVARAADQQLAELGISDHLILGPAGVGPFSWSLRPDNLDVYISEVRKAGESAALPVRLGVEVDYFPGQMKTIEDLIAGHDFDYLIGSVHFVDAFPVDESRSCWEPLSQEEINAICRGYWQRVAQMAATGSFHLAGHIDLVKKFAFRSNADLSVETASALDAIAESGMAVELNTSGWDKPCREAYPSESILAQAISRGIPILVTADAHRAIDLTNHFEQAFELLRQLGVRETVRFSEGKAVRVALR